MHKLLLVFAAIAATAMGQLFGNNGITKCSLLKPTNADCCFMLDSQHDRSRGSQDLTTSPYNINLVHANGKTLNKFSKTDSHSHTLWNLTALMDDPNNPGEQIIGKSIRLQLYAERSSDCFDQFWVQAHKLIPVNDHKARSGGEESIIAGSFVEFPGKAEFPKDSNGKKVGCDKRLFYKNTDATIVSADSTCKKEVDLEWIPPPKCTEDEKNIGNTLLCRLPKDLYFFTFTMGKSSEDQFWVGQTSFGFYVNILED